jgi:hypothetical protein
MIYKVGQFVCPPVTDIDAGIEAEYPSDLYETSRYLIFEEILHAYTLGTSSVSPS